MRKLLFLSAVLAACASVAGAQEKLTYADLVRRLTDLERLSVLPATGETCRQWSSYNRLSRYDAAAGKYVRWNQNIDGMGVIRREGDEEVFAEMKGPGCIWRIWSARPQAGHVKVYLDGAKTPAVDLPFDGYFNGKSEPFVYGSLVHTTARGRNNYVPIPYRKSCRIVGAKDWGKFFLIDYTTFPPGTEVPTFRRELPAEGVAALRKADEFLGNWLGTDPGGRRAGQVTETRTLTLAGATAGRAATLKGPRAITAIRIRMDAPGLQDRAAQVAALRQLALRITWDGEKSPAVWCPLGDFFGTAPGVNKYKSLPMGMTDEGFYCFWYMPFATAAEVELVNDGAIERKLTVELTHAPLSRPIDRLGRFHAKWHRDALLPREPERKIDWTLLRTTGRGRFVGTMLHVWNPRGRWWGEGDEKFFVDGEKFPSWFGTGSEDYFGYAWCNPELFQNAYHNQTLCTRNVGHVSVNRWHITDNVPFQTSFEGAIEKYFPNARPTLYAAVVYWYLADGGQDPYPELPLDKRVGYWGQPVGLAAKGAVEGERMRPLSVGGGRVSTQAMDAFGRDKWSGGTQLWWTRGKVGDRLTLAMRVPAAGRYELKFQLTKAKDYAIVQLYFDGRKLGKPIDLYNPNVLPTGELSLGTLDLAAGSHRLTVEIVGANPQAKKAYLFGLDYIRFVPAK